MKSAKKAIKNFQVIVTAAYGISIIMGMIFSSAKFDIAGINIFEYAEIFDFLVYPFIEPTVIVFSFLPIIFVYLLVVFDEYIKNKKPDFYRKKTIEGILGLIDMPWWKKVKRTIMLVTFIPLYLAASYFLYKQYIFKNYKTMFECVVLEFHEGDIIEGKILGKVKDMIFIIKNCPCEINNTKINEGEEVLAIPYGESIKKIRWIPDCNENS